MEDKDVKSLAKILEELEENNKGNDARKIIPTGFSGIDRTYFGIGPRELWVVGAYSGSGKTFFLAQLLLNVIKQGKAVAYYSLEMSREALASRLWANVSGIAPATLEWGNITLEQQTSKVEAITTLKAYGELAYLFDDRFTIEEIDKSVAELRPNLVIIDYLQNLQGNFDEYQKLTNAMGKLQQMTKKYDLAIIAASQVSNAEAKEGADSKIIGYKGSGAIAAAADFGIWLQNEADYNSESDQPITLTVRKSRRGPKRKFDFKLVFPSGRFEFVPRVGET